MIDCLKLYSPGIAFLLIGCVFLAGVPRTNETIAFAAFVLAATVFVSETEAKRQRRVLARRVNARNSERA